MKTYRVYYAKDGGRLEQGESFACSSDAEALARARQVRPPPGASVELWEGGRQLARFPPPARG